MLQSNEEVLQMHTPLLSPEYTRRGVYRYVMMPETVNIRDRQILTGGGKFLPSGELIEIADIPVPYHDTDTLEDERENADVAIANKNSPTSGAKFKFKTSYAIVDELVQNFSARGLVYFEALSTTTSDGRRAAAMVEAKLRLGELFDSAKTPTLQAAVERLEEFDVTGIPHGEACVMALYEGLSQAILYREAWASTREAEIQLAQKGKAGRAATYKNEREYAASIGIFLTDANVLKRTEPTPGAEPALASSSPSDMIATKFLLEQNEALAEENTQLKGQVNEMAANLAAIMKKLNIKPTT